MMTVYDNFVAGKYANPVPYPSRPNKPILSRSATSDDAKRYAESLVAWEATMEKFKEDERKYREAKSAAVALLKHDLEDEFGVSNNPKKEKLWSLVWDMAHSSGLHDVINVYGDLVDLIN